MRMCQRNHRCQYQAFSILRDGDTLELKTMLLAAPHNMTELPMTHRINPLTPKDLYSGRTAPRTSKYCILYLYSTNTATEYFNHGIH